MPTTAIDFDEIIAPACVKVPLSATEKKAAIEELVDLLEAGGQIRDGASLKTVVWEREAQRSTGIGEGLAIPHGKCEKVDRLVMAVGKPDPPMEFGSVDRKPVHLIVLLASPPDRTADHIQALGKLSRLMSNPATREAAYAAETAEELRAIMTVH